MTVNIVDTGAVSRYLHQQCDGDEQVSGWLEVVLGKSLRKRPESAMPVDISVERAAGRMLGKITGQGPFHKFEPDAALTGKVRHVKDWLVSAQQNLELFLNDVDERGRPRKLLNLDLDRAVVVADKYFARLNQRLRGAVEDEHDVKTVMRFEDGSRIVQLLTPAALKYEGPNMGHCIAGGSYDTSLQDGSCTFYSLRDANNQPHATLEVLTHGNILRQCRGKENLPPVQKYMPPIQAFVRERAFELEEQVAFTGLVKDVAGKYHSIHALPDHLSVKSLDLTGCTITSLPAHLSVAGSAILYECPNLSEIGTGLAVEKQLRIFHCPQLRTLPDHLTAGGLVAKYSDLVAVPDHLTVHGDVDVSQSPMLASAGDNVQIDGIFDAHSCPSLRRVTGKISADEIDFSSCETLAFLSDSLFASKLKVPNCGALTALPKLHVEYLDIGGSGIARLPDTGSLHVLIADTTNLPGIPKDFRVQDTLYVSGCDWFTDIPDNWLLRKGLDAGSCKNFKTIGNNVRIGGEVVLSGSGLQSIGNDFTAGGLIVSGCSDFATIGANATIGGRFDINFCFKLRSIGEALRVNGDIYAEHGDTDQLYAIPRSALIVGQIRSRWGNHHQPYDKTERTFPSASDMFEWLDNSGYAPTLAQEETPKSSRQLPAGKIGQIPDGIAGPRITARPSGPAA